ncbi:hypothetical protein LEMLEM_LOCUS4204 [Lemmus lemmus]
MYDNYDGYSQSSFRGQKNKKRVVALGLQAHEMLLGRELKAVPDQALWDADPSNLSLLASKSEHINVNSGLCTGPKQKEISPGTVCRRKRLPLFAKTMPETPGRRQQPPVLPLRTKPQHARLGRSGSTKIRPPYKTALTGMDGQRPDPMKRQSQSLSPYGLRQHRT